MGFGPAMTCVCNPGHRIRERTSGNRQATGAWEFSGVRPVGAAGHSGIALGASAEVDSGRLLGCTHATPCACQPGRTLGSPAPALKAGPTRYLAPWRNLVTRTHRRSIQFVRDILYDRRQLSLEEITFRGGPQAES